MAKARKSAAKGYAGSKKRKTGIKTKTKKRKVRKTQRKPQGVAEKVASAVRLVMDTAEETSRLRRQAGHRGGIDEG
jgi:hypothetical protein